MSCSYTCHLCDNLIISESVTFTAPNLIIDLPAGSYTNGGTYCIVVAQAIPDTTTITAPVFITIIAVSSVCLLVSLGYLIFIDKSKPERSTPTQRKDFFIFASIGLFIVTFSWLTTFFAGL